MANKYHAHSGSDRVGSHTVRRTGLTGFARAMLPNLIREVTAPRQPEKRSFRNDTRLICIYCGWAPKQRQWLEEWEGGFVCKSGEKCQERQREAERDD